MNSLHTLPGFWQESHHQMWPLDLGEELWTKIIFLCVFASRLPNHWHQVIRNRTGLREPALKISNELCVIKSFTVLSTFCLPPCFWVLGIWSCWFWGRHADMTYVYFWFVSHMHRSEIYQVVLSVSCHIGLSRMRWDFYSNILATSFVGSGGGVVGQWHLSAVAIAIVGVIGGEQLWGQQSLQQRFLTLRVPSELPWVEVFLISHQPEGRHGSELPWLVPPCSSGSAISVHFKRLISWAEVLCPLCLK